jgi:hypothetical protein
VRIEEYLSATTQDSDDDDSSNDDASDDIKGAKGAKGSKGPKAEHNADESDESDVETDKKRSNASDVDKDSDNDDDGDWRAFDDGVKQGTEIEVIKGATPQVLAHLQDAVDDTANRNIMKAVDECAERGLRTVAVARRKNGGEWKFWLVQQARMLARLIQWFLLVVC